jgi:hypothetical protein
VGVQVAAIGPSPLNPPVPPPVPPDGPPLPATVEMKPVDLVTFRTRWLPVSAM